MYKFTKSILFSSLLFTSVSNAQVELLESNTRPRISEVLQYHQDYKPENGIPAKGDRLAFDHFRMAIEDGAPQFIAKLEKAYPGAIFAFMGRDTQAISDVVDAFFQSIGQKNRVLQIGMSKPTLVGLSDKEIEKYLKFYGLDLDQIRSSKSFIFVDTVSSGEVIDGVRISGRQGRNLLQIIYKAWIKRGYDPKDLLAKVNMVALRVSTFKANDVGNIQRYKDISEMKEVLKANQAILDKKTDISKIGMDMVLPLIVDTPNLFNESGYDHFTGAWHEKFQPPTKNITGLVPNPGTKTDANYRRSILWLQHKIIDIVSSSEFRKKIKLEGEKFGVNYHGLKLDQTLVSCKKIYK